MKNKTYNNKEFLTKTSKFSMSAIHAVIEDEGIAHFRISDCTKTIHIWNDLNESEQITEMIEKLEKIAKEAKAFANHIKKNYNCVEI